MVERMTPEQKREHASRLYEQAAQSGNMDLYAEADAYMDMADDEDSIASEAQWEGTWEEDEEQGSPFTDSYEQDTYHDEEDDIGF